MLKIHPWALRYLLCQVPIPLVSGPLFRHGLDISGDFCKSERDLANLIQPPTHGPSLMFLGRSVVDFAENGSESPLMNPLYRIIKADDTRKTRFHTSNGHLCLHPLEILRALGTSFNRVVLRRYARTPWLAFSAVDYLRGLVSGRRVFEFGSGMSTLWFAERCREVVSVESDSTWHRSMTRRTEGLRNVQLVFANSKESYIEAIAKAGGKFDLILVDGLHREQCVDLARMYLNPDGILIVDNTDSLQRLADQIKHLFSDSDVRVFRGWVPGNLHPNETTIIQKIPSINAVNPSFNLS